MEQTVPTWKHVRLVFLDFDGVIVQSNEIKDRAFSQIFSRFPAQVEALQAFHDSRTSMPRRQKFAHAVEVILGRPGDQALIDQMCADYEALTQEQVIACPMCEGAEEFLRRTSRKIPLILASATPQEHLDDIIDRRNMRGYFAKVYGSPQKKEDIFRAELRERDIGASQVWFFGDSREDLASARVAGCPFIGIVGKSDFVGDGVPVFDSLAAATTELEIEA